MEDALLPYKQEATGSSPVPPTTLKASALFSMPIQGVLGPPVEFGGTSVTLGALNSYKIDYSGFDGNGWRLGVTQAPWVPTVNRRLSPFA